MKVGSRPDIWLIIVQGDRWFLRWKAFACNCDFASQIPSSYYRYTRWYVYNDNFSIFSQEIESRYISTFILNYFSWINFVKCYWNMRLTKYHRFTCGIKNIALLLDAQVKLCRRTINKLPSTDDKYIYLSRMMDRESPQESTRNHSATICEFILETR